MRLTAAAAILFAAVFPAATNAAEHCSKRELGARGTATIDLDPAAHEVRKHFGFYFVGPRQQHFVLFFKPEDVLALVEKRAGHDRDFHEVLEAMRGDLPLNSDTDLFKYALRSNAFEVDIDDMVAELLDAGKVFVDVGMINHSGATPADPNDRNDPRSIRRVNWEEREMDGRSYCAGIGFELLRVIDTIYG